ncbi:hypothetical protein BST81_19510 [Leptolyngbya sp. 'hensonii']|uniref:hypothetical protein n=1 Tax=Leptolyngbya sp. 'hensonii' TaxID=1922337 RepID=UPI000964C213|nr:hypothetical protein [Leptolyngbya sp. 'hensonii']OLP16629.1 hypothetical protein BST81_19510 [Leptolyngbya sp. 'hensonii']
MAGFLPPIAGMAAFLTASLGILPAIAASKQVRLTCSYHETTPQILASGSWETVFKAGKADLRQAFETCMGGAAPRVFVGEEVGKRLYPLGKPRTHQALQVTGEDQALILLWNRLLQAKQTRLTKPLVLAADSAGSKLERSFRIIMTETTSTRSN